MRGGGLSFEAFVVLRETVVIAQRSRDSITFSHANAFERVSQSSMLFGPRDCAFLFRDPRGGFHIAREERWSAGDRMWQQPRVASFTMIALPPALASGHVLITDDDSTRTLLQNTPVKSLIAHADCRIGNRRRGDGDDICRLNLIGTKDVSGDTIAFVVSEAEFESQFVKPVAFLAGKTSWQTRLQNSNIFVEHADSLYVVDRKGLIHITPENNMKNAAEFVALNATDDTDTLVYFK